MKPKTYTEKLKSKTQNSHNLSKSQENTAGLMSNVQTPAKEDKMCNTAMVIRGQKTKWIRVTSSCPQAGI